MTETADSKKVPTGSTGSTENAQLLKNFKRSLLKTPNQPVAKELGTDETFIDRKNKFMLEVTKQKGEAAIKSLAEMHQFSIQVFPPTKNENQYRLWIQDTKSQQGFILNKSDSVEGLWQLDGSMADEHRRQRIIRHTLDTIDDE